VATSALLPILALNSTGTGATRFDGVTPRAKSSRKQEEGKPCPPFPQRVENIAEPTGPTFPQGREHLAPGHRFVHADGA
jgi:hypothetical protein